LAEASTAFFKFLFLRHLKATCLCFFLSWATVENFALFVEGSSDFELEIRCSHVGYSSMELRLKTLICGLGFAEDD